MAEELPRAAPPKGLGSGGRRGGHLDFVALRGETAGPPRLLTGIAELDRVCGGGLVAGSTILVGGDPGIGKSTLLLQAAAALAAGGSDAAYITGEEAIDQVRLRAERLGVADTPVHCDRSMVDRFELIRERRDAIAPQRDLPSRRELEHRLRTRSEDPDEVIARRLKDAAEEIRNYEIYDYVLINRQLAEAEATLCAIVRAERARRTRIEDQIRPILNSFKV